MAITKAKPYNTTMLLKELDIPETYSADSMFKKLSVNKTYGIDVMLSAIYKWYNIDVILKDKHTRLYWSMDTIFKKSGFKTPNIGVLFAHKTSKTNSIDALLQNKTYPTDSLDVLFKMKVATTVGIDCILLQGNPPIPSDQATLHINNPNGDLWCFPIKWKETQRCTPAIRPIPLAESEYLDSGSFVLEPRQIDATFRLSDREKDVFESIYAYASTTGANYLTNFYLRYNFIDSHHPDSHTQPPQYTWYYVGWISDKDYSFEYSMQDGRYVRWWTVKVKIDVNTFSGSSANEPTYANPFSSAITLDGHKIVQILDFYRSDQHPPMIPKWVNRPAEVDSYIWNECVLDITYLDRMSNDEKYLMDISMLQQQYHTKVPLIDYIHNVIGNVWISEVEATFDADNWAKPWKYSVYIQGNNSEIAFNTTTSISVDSWGVSDVGAHSGPDSLGILYIDEVLTNLTLPSSITLDLGVHVFYFFLPSVSLGFYQWNITGDACLVSEEGTYDVHTFDRESRASILIWGQATIIPEYIVPQSITCVLSSNVGGPCIGTPYIHINGSYYNNLPRNFVHIPDTYTDVNCSPTFDIYIFDHWITTGSVTVDGGSISSNPTPTVVISGNGGLEAVYKLYIAPQHYSIDTELAITTTMQIPNGDFETGELTPFYQLSGYVEIYTQVPHSGIYDVLIYYPMGILAVDMITVFGQDIPVENFDTATFWAWRPAYGNGVGIEIYYSDSTIISPQVNIPVETWTQVDIKPYLTAGKTVTRIGFSGYNTNVIIDDVVIICKVVII